LLSNRTNHLVPSRGFHAGFALSLLAVAFAWPLSLSAQTQTPSSRPVSALATPLGKTLTTIIVFGDQYNGGDELYDVKITVTDVLRGDKSPAMIEAAGNLKPAAGPGLEFLLANVRFEFAARAEPHHYDYTLEPRQFSAMSASTTPYSAALLAGPVEPQLRGLLRSGDSKTGWLVFIVPQGDHTPLLMFRADVGSVIHEGDVSFFRLYPENSTATSKAKSP
jgi:hypothetical protein